MKFWRYYKKAEKDDVDKVESLYAITTKKELAKEFERNRDMKKFRKVVSDEDRDFIHKFTDSNLHLLIDEVPLLTTNIVDGKILTTITNIYVPFHEQQLTCDTDAAVMLLENNSIGWDNSVPFEVYNSEIREALSVLQYPECHALALHEESGYGYPLLSVDEVGMYIMRYGDMLK